MLEKLFLEKILDTKIFYENKVSVDLTHEKSGLYVLYLIYEGFCCSFSGFKISRGNEEKEAGVAIINHPKKVRSFLDDCNYELKLVVEAGLLHDIYTNQSGLSYYLYKNDPNRKNYVVSKNLSECLSKINMDIPISAIPKGPFNAYFEFKGITDDEGDLIRGCFISIVGLDADYQCILISAITDDHLGGTQMHAVEASFMHIDRGRYKTMEEFYNKTPLLNEEGKNKLKQSKTTRMLLNAMLYVTNPNEEFKEEYNKFATKESKRKVQKKIYSNEPITKIGYGEDTTFLKMLVTKKTDVEPYWRNQHYGPKNIYTKYILVAGYERKQHSYFDQTKGKKDE